MGGVSTAWPRLGAVRRGEGAFDFAVWAPSSERVWVRVHGHDHELDPGADGVFEGAVECDPGDDYAYVLDGGDAWPDPCSRSQPLGTHGPSRVVELAFDRDDAGWAGLSLDALVIYELHVGTFSQAGTFDGAIERLPALRELGVTAIELMPIATFPGNRNWGYDGVYTSAPHPAYGGPEGFARLVDAAHREGLGVILDVVYNHVGPGSEALSAFGPYFTDREQTGWGDAIDYRERGVREWAIQNAELWVRDYRVDGLRLDATHAVFDDSPKHVLAELAERVRSIRPQALVISEMETGDLRPIREWGHDAQWADEFHHLLHMLLTGEQEGYYGDYPASVRELARQYEREPADRLVFCSQNHDQVGNRALGDRPKPDELRLRAAALLWAPQTPLLFMGEEYGEQRPFQFFTDHTDPAIAEATREGRAKEFEKFSAFSGQDVPDPQDAATFERSKLDPGAGDPDLLAFYTRLLELRRRSPEFAAEADEARRLLMLRRGDAELVLNFSDAEQDGVPPRDVVLRA
jgi:maltooligosyltrehalose trehalohydrolase